MSEKREAIREVERRFMSMNWTATIASRFMVEGETEEFAHGIATYVRLHDGLHKEDYDNAIRMALASYKPMPKEMSPQEVAIKRIANRIAECVCHRYADANWDRIAGIAAAAIYDSIHELQWDE